MFRNPRLLIPLAYAVVVIIVFLFSITAGTVVAVAGGIAIGLGFVVAGRRRRV